MFAFQLPAPREWPVPGRKLLAQLHAVWKSAPDQSSWADERERQEFLRDLDRRRLKAPFAGHLRIY